MRRARGVLRAVVALGALAIVVGTWRAARRPPPGSDVRFDDRAAVVRGGRRIAGIERLIRPRGRARLPQLLAPAAGPTIDSARVGFLVPRLASGSLASAPVVALVPRDSVVGLPAVARLVVTPGEAGLLVFGAPAGPR